MIHSGKWVYLFSKVTENESYDMRRGKIPKEIVAKNTEKIVYRKKMKREKR